MGNAHVQPQDMRIDYQNDSFHPLPFLVTGVTGILSTFTSCLCCAANLAFYGTCSLVFRSFKALYLMFQLFDAFFAFLKSLLQFNYSLVTRGLGVLEQLSTTSYRQFRFGFSASYDFVTAIPYFCLNIIICCLTVTAEFFYGVWETVFQSLAGLQIIITQFCTSTLYPYLEITKCWLACAFSSIIKFPSSVLAWIKWLMLNKLPNVGAKLICFFADALVYVSKEIHSVLMYIMSSVLPLFHAITFAASSVFDFLTEIGNQISAVFENLAECIILPFSYENTKALVSSLLNLVINILTVPFAIATALYDIASYSVTTLKYSITGTGNYILAFFETISTSLWILIIFISCLVVSYLLRETHVLTGLHILMQRFFAGLYSLWTQQRAVANPSNPDERRNLVVEQNNADQQHQNEHVFIRNEQANTAKDIKPPIQPTQDEEDEKNLCIICQEKEKTTVLLPCRHLCACNDCAQRLISIERRHKDCPLCRVKIREILNVYL